MTSLLLALLRAVWLLGLLLALPGRLLAQVLDPAFHIPEIYRPAAVGDAAQQPDGQYVVTGSFVRANGQASGGLERYDASGVIDPVFHKNLRAATVKALRLYPAANGQLLVVGDYRAGAVQRQNLFRLNADGTLDASFTSAVPGLVANS